MLDRKIPLHPAKKPLRSAKKDVGKMLLAQIQNLLGSEHPVTPKREKPWASITFSGTRHYLEVACSKDGIEQRVVTRLNGLPEQEFDLPGHFVADLLVRDYEAGESCIRIEVLTIIDPISTGTD